MKKNHNEKTPSVAQLTIAPMHTGKILGGMKWYLLACHQILNVEGLFNI
jgi:hypothetical protein